MASKETGQHVDIGVLVNEANKYRHWQHKIFRHIATGDEYQLILFVWDWANNLNVVLANCKLPKYKIVMHITQLDIRFELVKT